MYGWRDSLRFYLDGERYILTDRLHRLDDGPGVELHPREAYQVLVRLMGPSLGDEISRDGSLMSELGCYRGMQAPLDELPEDLVLYRVPRWTHTCRLDVRIDTEPDVVNLVDMCPEAVSLREDEWIDVAVVDQDDRPVPLVEYEIRLSNGCVRRGRTNEDGRLYYDEIPAGHCEITLLGMDGDLWHLIDD